MNRISILITAIISGFFLLVPSVLAVNGQEIRNEVRVDRQEIIEAQKEERNEIREEVKKKAESQVEAIKNFFGARAKLENVKATAIDLDNTSITVTKDDISYTVNVDEKTRLRRRFYGSLAFEDIRVGDILNVFGKWSDADHKIIDATLIRDMSDEKRFGAFVGDVTAIGENGITIKTVHRGTLTATFTDTTKIVNRKEIKITLNDIKVGDRVRIKGLWDKEEKTVTDVTNVKDYSLPVQATPTAKST